MGPFHACNGPHLVRDCNESICNRCKPNLDNCTPAKYIRKRPPSRQQKLNPLYNKNNIRSQPNDHNDPNVQLLVSSNKLDHIAELLEATKKIMKYFKKSYQHNKRHYNSSNSHHSSRGYYNAVHSDKHKCKSHNPSNLVNEIIGQTCTSKTTKSEPEDIKQPHYSDSPDNLDFS